jgi:hypothetical protein
MGRRSEIPSRPEMKRITLTHHPNLPFGYFRTIQRTSTFVRTLSAIVQLPSHPHP